MNELQFRRDTIEERFAGTFDWIFDTTETGFTEWLQNGSGIFWINGKPGSGKSTLMKFIVEAQRTRDYLMDWNLDDPYLVASFFFHHRGSPMQKSFEGLLRSILAQMLSHSEDLWPVLLSEFGSELPLDATLLEKARLWTLPRLKRWIMFVLEQNEVPLHLVLFLDAVDEFDGPKEFICDFLRHMSKITPTTTKNVKICFSSRPWQIFLANFSTCAGFQLQDFTGDDIRDYCVGLIRTQVAEARSLDELVPEIVAKAEGIFLWIKLVIKDLTTGLRRGSDPDGLKKRLYDLPTELGDYYNEIIQRIPKGNRWRTYMTLEMVARSDGIICSEKLLGKVELLLSHSRTEGVRTRRMTVTESNSTPLDQIARNGGGLIEIVVNRFEEEQVQFIHQTVRDFVADPSFKQRVLEGQADLTTSNGHTFLAQAGLLQHGFGKPNRRTIRHAWQTEQTTGRSLKTFLDHHVSAGKGLCLPLTASIRSLQRAFLLHQGLAREQSRSPQG